MLPPSSELALIMETTYFYEPVCTCARLRTVIPQKKTTRTATAVQNQKLIITEFQVVAYSYGFEYCGNLVIVSFNNNFSILYNGYMQDLRVSHQRGSILGCDIVSRLKQY